MKKYLLALTALTLSTCAFGTMAGGGDIRSIESINDTAHGITFPNVTQPLVAGESLYVRIRLIDDDFMAVDGSHKWRFMPVTAGSLEVADALNQPKLRLSVGGNIVEATYTDFGPTATDLGGAMTPWPKHTDLYFKYTVSAGDLGGPVKVLWGNNSVAGTTASALTLLHVNTYAGLTGQPWNLINESTGNLATMLYAPTSPYPQELPLPSAAKLSMNYLEEQVYVKTIDFEPQYANEDAMPEKVWRDVYLGDSMAVDASKPVQVEGAVTGAVVFVWSADPTVVRVVAGDDGELVPGSDVLKVKVAAGIGRFRLEGVQENKTAKIYMSSQMDHAYTTVGESLEAATVVRTVQVVPPPKPYVTISDYAGATRKIELEAKADYETPAVFKVKLSARPTVDDHDVVINLNPQFARSGTLVELTELNPLVNRYVAILPDKDGDPDGDPTQLAASVTSVKLPTGQTEAVFYVYPFGRPTDKTVNQLWFKPTVAGADADFYAGSKNDAQCLVSDVAPAFENFSAPSTAVQGDTITVAFSVSDNWRDLQTALNTNGYDVVISLNGQKLYTTNAWNFAANLDAEFSIVVPENLMGADIEGLVTVKDKTHAAATEQPFKLTVTEKPIYTAKPIFQGPEGSYDPVSGMYTFCEGDQIPLSVNFSLPNTTGDRYAFIVPADTMSSNLVETTALTNGLPIVATGANPTNSLPALITFIDGDEISKTQTQHATKGRFNIVLGTQPTMDAPGFAFDTVYACGSVSFTVTNAAPTVVGVSKGAEYVEEDDDPSRVKGGVLTTSIPSGVPVFFTAKIDDLGLIDATNGTARVKWVWTDGDQEEGAEDPDAGKYSDFCYSNVSTNGITQAPITFSSAYQNQMVRLYVQDRDQKAVGAGFGSKAAFQFKVKVVDMPKVYLSFAEGISDGNGNGIYHESTSYKDSSRPAFTVKVSEFPKRNSDFYTDPDSLKQDPKFDAKNPMVVRVTMGLPNDSSRIALVTNYVYFTSETQTKTGQKVYFDPVFQNGGPTEADTLPEPIAVTVEVMNGNIAEGFEPSRNKDELPWCDYYATSDAALYMCNDAPKKFNLVSGTEGIALHLNGTNTWTTGQQIKINWTLGDIAYDLTNGVSYIELENITDLGGKTIIKVATNDTFTAGTTPLYGNTVAGSFAFKVPADSTEVKVRAFDGEGGMIEKVFFINIVPTKKVQINPFGPSPATDTKYDTAPGRGKGHIYVDDSTGSYVLRQFKQTWTYNESSQQAHVFAVGYLAKDGDAYDKGNIDKGYTGAALGPTGNAPNGTADTDYYNYGNSPYDNFFYTWASNTAGEDGKLATKLTVLPPQPAKIKGYMADKLFMLDNGQNNQGNAQNNNQKKTGYATVEVEAIFAREHLAGDNMGDINRDFIPDVYTKYYKGLGVYSPEGEITGDDLAELTITNPDADYLPNSLTALYATVIPGLSNTWVTAGRAFTTKMEIRGAGDGFNDAPAIANVPEVMPERIYLDPEIVGEENSTLSHLEYIAFTNWCGRTAADTNECANLITNAANWVKWSPERPTDPTKADTDGDGLPDGYEYFFWYRAHVGYLDDDGNYYRQTGRKYNPLDPTAPIEITPEEIEAAYDPIVANPEIDQVDSDNDGIIDAIEFEIGTNPFDYDTDGDGLPDGYEAFISQTNPMVADRGSNGDGDQMALITLENVIPVTCVYKEDDNTVTNMLWSMESVRVAPNEEDDAITNLTTKTSLFTGYVYDIDNEGKPVWALGRLVLDAKDAKYDDKVKEYNVIHVGEGRSMRAIHFQVFAIKGFDPRVAWNTEAAVMVPIAHRVDTTGFTAYDEFMTMTFFLNVGAIEEADVTPKPNRTLVNIWTECTTNPLNADTDGDGVPDGWELYVMGQGGFVCNNPMPPAGNSHDNHSPMINWTGHDDVIGGLNYVEEFCGIESCARYENCETIVNVQPEWKNKYWPTNPFNKDTDGDGVTDSGEKTFIYGDAPASTVYSGAIPGGGLNPNSWDTDLDGLPDGWELQFACSILVSSTTTTVETHSDTNGTSTVTNTVTTAGGPQADGMDGTVKDQMKDYDHDGLNNWQEYMVGAMRCWRYDDVTTPWTSTMLTDADLEAMSGEDFYQMLIDPWVDLDDPEATPLTYAKYNPFLGTGVVSPYVYFSCCNNAFDLAAGRLYMFKDGIYHDLTNDKRDGENRWSAKIMKFRPKGMGFMTHDTLGRPAAPRKYISCDPTNADTDGDGMDDYYELYHGINPLLGRANGKGDSGLVDVVARAYYDKDELPFPVNATDNFWFNASAVNTGTTSAKAQLKDEDQSMYDFVQFPWLNGLPEADPDGDNIRNAQESILPIAQAAATYQHIDPSPLWMTDTSYTNSLVSRFYYPTLAISSFNHSGSFMHTDADGNTTTYNFSEIPGFKFEEGLVTVTASRNPFKTFGTAFAYEENEGYDTDHDYLSDFEESQGKTKSASDPQMSDDPIRHQAMYFNGEDAFLQTQLPEEWILPNEESVAEFRQNFLYFTVEAWVKADASLVGEAAKPGLFTVIERPIWTGASNAGDESFLRKNFLIGIKNGRWYAKFDSTGTDLNQPIEIKEGPEATAAWTHVAATFGPADEADTEGTGPMALKLYVDGILRKSLRSGVQPEHGVQAFNLTPKSKIVTVYEWEENPLARPMVSMIVGASAKTMRGIVFDQNWGSVDTPDMTTVADYANFFKGHVDEVRIWDGARSAAAIKADVEQKTRYTTALALENRRAVYAKWSQDITRMPNASGEMLPPELMYHFSFDHIPGAVEAKDVLKTPAGFTTTKGAVDAKAKWSRPDGWVCPWWDSLTNTLRSSVYTDTAWVPWIGNTVGHLPMFDGETLDSVLWHKEFYGFTPGSFVFPLSSEPISRMIQQHYLVENKGDPETQTTSYDRIAESEDEVERFRFTYRNRVTAGSDLLPFGGAFPKRLSSAEGLWDAPGVASDAWAETGVDADNNGLPEWWEEYALVEYADTTSVDWDTIVERNGQQMPAWQAYLRDLAAGMLPDGVIHPEYADTRDMDKDGLPDWWEDMYGINTHSASDADADPDHDGLSNYQEYVLSELYPKKYDLASYGITPILLDPTRDRSGLYQQVTDYYLSYTNTPVVVKNAAGATVFEGNNYFGEIVTDHDFMEDWWEIAMGSSYANAKKYDPLADRDEDGWSNWAECRAALWGGYFSANLIDKWTGSQSDQHVTCYPEPIIGVRVTYHGVRDISGQTLIVKTTSGQTARTDATFMIPSELDGQVRYIGGFNADNLLHGHMSPGCLNVNSIMFECARTSSDHSYTWNCDWYIENEGGEPNGWGIGRTHNGSFETYRSEFALWPKIELEGGDLTWETMAQTVPSTDLNSATLIADGNTIGSVNAVTGEYEIDFSKFTKAGGAKEYVYRVTYTSRVGREWPQTVYVSDTRELASGNGETAKNSYGRVREGRNTIEAFMDLNQNGVLDAGEPYGSIRNVQIGWHKVPTVIIELKDASPIMGQVQLAAATGEGLTELTKTVRIVRELINDQPAPRTLVTKTLVMDDRPYLTEVDACTVTRPDLDWVWLTKDAERDGIQTINRATYAVYEYDQNMATNGALLATFIKEFPEVRPMATAVAPKDVAPVYSCSPTFAFTTSDEKATAYRLQVRLDGATAPIYDSGIQLLPGRLGQTVGVAAYEVTPAIYADAPIYTGTTTNHAIFADGTNYQWRVALYDSKYKSTKDDSDVSGEWGAWATFQMDLANKNRYPGIPTGYGATSVAVRYFGSADCDSKRIVVEAYENADFRGQALAQIRLSDATTLRDATDLTTYNAVLRGIKPGTVYFRAFYDQNNNGVRDNWESWGYANNVGKNVTAIYNPVGREITTSTADWVTQKSAAVTIFMEDCDVNQNEIPDCTEESLFLAEVSAETDPVDWWDWAEANPTDVNGDEAMAYAEVTMWKVKLVDENGVENTYLTDGQGKLVEGVSAAGLNFWSYYDYSLTLLGLGTNVTTNVTAKCTIAGRPEEKKVALVHAQVLEKYGFCPDTAIPGGQTNTKPFTAMDKYLVLRYLERTGRITLPASTQAELAKKGLTFEEYVYRSGDESLYKMYTLNPAETDNDHDGIDDGWELYIDGNPLSDANRDEDEDGDGLPLWQEYDHDPVKGTYRPTNPSDIDTDADGVTDKYAYMYHLKADDAGKDFDGDGLSNYAEYLITEVFKYAVCNPDVYATNDGVCDYFRKVGDVYLGEIFTDHDQVDDVWESQYKVDYANRYVYDPTKDADNDGWSNWAEYKAGTDPERVNTLSIGTYTLPEYPIPAIEANVIYNGASVGLHPIVFKAWNESTDFDMVKAPDAIWTLGTAVSSTDGDSSGDSAASSLTLTQREKFLGRKPTGTRTYHLPGGAISEGSIKLLFMDKGYGVVRWDPLTQMLYAVANGEPDKAKWYYGIYDKDGKLVRIGNAFDEKETTVGTVDYATGEITIDFDHEENSGKWACDPGDAVSGGDNNNNNTDNETQANIYEYVDFDNAYVRITWASAKVNESISGMYYLTDSDPISEKAKSYGHIREGKNTFICFVDDNEDGEYTPGELFGVVRGVNVGWAGVKFDVELTETHPIFGRVDFSGLNDRQIWYGSDSGNFTNLVYGVPGTEDSLPVDSSLSGGRKQRVRVDRYAVNGMTLGTTITQVNVPNRVIVDKWFDVGARRYLHEGDFMEAGEFDIDWTHFEEDILNSRVIDQKFGGEVISMSYRIVVDNADFVHPVVSNRVLNVAFTRHFDSTDSRTQPSDLQPIMAYGARPVFKWSMNGHNSYTAFKLRILSGSQVVYESPMTVAPFVDPDGYYVYESPVSVGDQTALGRVLERAGNYTWTVSMYNSKFKSDYYATPVSFTTEVNTQQDVDDHGYGTIDVAVKYAGPEAVLATLDDLTKVAGKIRVQAFETPDFCGKPVVETFVTNKTSVTALTENRPNVRLRGVKPGTYYIRAYVDSDGDFQKSAWESWGGAKGSVLVAANAPIPTAAVWIEDADTDGDWLPDAWEYVTPGKTVGAKDIVVDNAGEIVLKETTFVGVTNGTAGVSSGLSGASLTFFQNLEAAKVMLNLGTDSTTSTIQAIREAVQKKIVPNTVHVKALVVDAANKKVKLSVGGEVVDSIAGHLLSPIYTIPTTATVTISLYTKASLVDVNWIWVKDYTTTVSTTLDTTVEVDIEEDLTSGFYKVEVVQ